MAAAQPAPQQHLWVHADPPAPEYREHPTEPRRDPREPLHVRTHTTTPQDTTLHGFPAFKEKKNKLHPLVRARPLIKHLLKASKMHYKYPRIQCSAVQAQGGEPPHYFWKNQCFLPAPLLSSPIVWPPSSPTESSCTR